jgi:RNA polymerase sigma-70 factor (ECF subfamily)
VADVVVRDEALALAAQKGNAEAFASLVDRHKGRVYRTLYQVVGHDQDAQDLAQEVFLRLYRSLDSFRGDAAFTTWLHRLTINIALDWLRARKRRPLQVPLEPPPDEPDGPVRELRSDGLTPEEEALRSERQRQIRHAIMDLSQDYREVVMLYHFQHLSYQQIADRLGVPVRTVETRLYRAKRLLKEALTAKEGELAWSAGRS